MDIDNDLEEAIDKLVEEITDCVSNKYIETNEHDNSNFPKERVKKRKCPECGGNLLVRVASRGNRAGKEFWGCSNYPKCKFIENI